MASDRGGQAALEYMVIMALALFLTTPVILQTQQSRFVLEDSFENGLVRTALNNMEEAARLVNSQGEPARVTFQVRFPDRINKTNVTENYIYVERLVSAGRTAEFYAVFDFNVTGSIPAEQGIHTLVAEAEQDYVNITAK